MAMARMGYLSPAEAAKLAKKPLNVRPLREHGFASIRAPYFTQYVVRKLCERYGVRTV